MHRWKEARVVHHRKSLSIFAVALIRIVLPLPGCVISIGNFERHIQCPEHISNPAHLRACLKKHDLYLALIFDKQIVHDLLTRTNRLEFTFQSS